MHRKIDFFIMGAQKCGTTSLYEYLKQHTDIFLPLVKENRFFVDDAVYSLGHRYLEILYKDLTNEKLVGGANVQVMFFHYAVERIYSHNSYMKLITLLRNPIDRAYSAYWYARRNGYESCKTFEEALNMEASRLGGSLVEQADLTYLSHGHYFEQIEQYVAKFGLSNVYVGLTEDLGSSPESIVNDIVCWLNLEASETTIKVSKRSNVAGLPRWLRLQKALMAPDTLLKRLMTKITTLRMRYVLNRLIDKLLDINIKPFSYPPMKKTTRLYLAQYFEPHNRKLAELIGRDLTHWR